MSRVLQIRNLVARSQRTSWVILAIAIVILAGAIFVITRQTRGSIRAQISGRDRDILHAVTRMQMPLGAEAAEALGSIEDPANQLLVILETSRLSGVMGASLFNRAGRFVESVPGDLVEGEIPPEDLAILRSFKPVSHFYPAVRVSELFLPDATRRSEERKELPVLEISIPLYTQQDERLVGIAQFVVEGYSIAQEFRQLDRHLWQQAGTAFLAGAFILAVAVTWSFRRLHLAHRLLAERTDTLLQANQELALAAKTSAVGAVTSHLIHGLRNPLAGLQNFVVSLGVSVADDPQADLQQAIASARRMQGLINDVVALLREDESSGQYEIPIAELVELLAQKIQPLCAQRGVCFTTAVEPEAILPNRAANLVGLVLANLVQNAVEMTGRGGEASLVIEAAGDALRCEVRDQGPGFPAGRPPFIPCQSQKEGGSGIGLAISKQLANHLGAGLELRHNSPQGCAFVLLLPAGLWKSKPNSSSVTLTLTGC